MHTVHEPSIPCTIPLHEDLVPGAVIDIHGHHHASHHDNFAIELLSGPHIVLHLNFRFASGDHHLVMNASRYGEWGCEERVHNPLGHGDHHFHLHIKVHDGHYDIIMDGSQIASFPHRFPYQSVQAVGIHGGIHVDKVKFEGFPFSHGWDRDHDFGHAGFIGYGTEGYVAPVFTDEHRHHSFWA